MATTKGKQDATRATALAAGTWAAFARAIGKGENEKGIRTYARGSLGVHVNTDRSRFDAAKVACYDVFVNGADRKATAEAFLKNTPK